ncbi:nitroreductase [Syntrophobotulus glycolicus DSM 8271]|uniref:Nitroreductase n=1 Tax=Syntrophobotulus glycolicus (strain DSM 8271 / FlGlyR) TaxID=645991 RepID=F0SXU9_SYNGF|nr:nitroreductase family protein [Syntrophobotulus glycolicus]ADY57010.1 nitroreductase [Syntrophobotulus glycolicus DSM 8271]
MIKDLIARNRTFRRFDQDAKISREILEELIELARLSSSGGNLQPLKYILSCDQDKNDLIFPYLKWAGYFTDWDGPVEGERPSAYVIMVADKEISSNYFWDHGIACQSILLGACEKGLGGCMFGSVDRVGLRNALKIPDRYEIILAIALGKPKEIVVLEEATDSKNIKYWRDEKAVHHVPKRKLQDILLN